MKKHTEPIQCDRFYHIYNKGINGETIFKEDRNYAFFLRKYAFYIQPIAETYAYCLLKNHFHLLIRTLTPAEIIENIGLLRKNANDIDKIEAIETMVIKGDFEEQITFATKQISNQFAKLFNSYAQSINKAHERTGG